MSQLVDCCTEASLRVFYAMHHGYRSADYETWKYIAPIRRAAWNSKAFDECRWGGEIRAAQKAWHPQAFRHRAHSTYVRGVDGSPGRRAWLRRDAGKRCDGRLRGRVHARRSRHQSPKLRQCHCEHDRTRRLNLFYPDLGKKCIVLIRRIALRISTN